MSGTASVVSKYHSTGLVPAGGLGSQIRTTHMAKGLFLVLATANVGRLDGDRSKAYRDDGLAVGGFVLPCITMLF